MCCPFGPAIVAASFASNSDRATMPICCTNASRPFVVASMASSSGSISCCIATLIVTGVPSCFLPLNAALFFMAAPLPVGAQFLADLILRPAEEPPLLHDFNRGRGIPALAHELHILVVAEGIETAGERDALAAIGCDLLQGYLFAKPGKPFPQVAW